jgi:DNA-binding NtrC family response regulator
MPATAGRSGTDAQTTLPLPQAVAELEARAIHQALQRTGGNKLAAARLLGISRATLYLKLPLVGAAGSAPHNAAQPAGD